MTKPTLELIYAFVHERRSSTPERFAAWLGGPVLVVKQTSNEHGIVPETRRDAPLPVEWRALVKLLREEAHRYQVARLAPQPPDEVRLLIGRAPECDVRVLDPSVSKRHAELVISPDGAVHLADVGSRHGSWVDDKRVETGTSLRLAGGETLRLGEATATFLGAEAFHRFLTSLLEPRALTGPRG
jgi:hypothetical protein